MSSFLPARIKGRDFGKPEVFCLAVTVAAADFPKATVIVLFAFLLHFHRYGGRTLPSCSFSWSTSATT